MITPITRTRPLIVFDLDGTLIDSVRDLAASASELATSLGGTPLELEAVAGMVGDGAPILVRRALAAAGVDPNHPEALPRFLDIYERRLLETTRPYPGIPEALTLVARRARLAVLTNKPLRPSQQLLDALNLSQYFEAVIGGDGAHGRKPHPGGLRALGGGADAVLLVGDSPIDYETAQAAGCPFAWARYGFGRIRFTEAAPVTPFVLDRPSDLAGVVDRFCATYSGR